MPAPKSLTLTKFIFRVWQLSPIYVMELSDGDASDKELMMQSDKGEKDRLELLAEPGNLTDHDRASGGIEITFTDANDTNAHPAIEWDSSDQNMKIIIQNGNTYRIWHEGNFNPNSMNPMNRKTFIGDGTTTVFNTGLYTSGNANVYYNGVRLFEPEDVDISSGTKIVFTEAPETGDRIDFEGFNNRLV
jgi:hypothetical protein